MFNNLKHSINMIIKCGIWQPLNFQLVSRFRTGSKMKWFFIVSELMLATIIQGYDKKKIISFQERETNWNLTGCKMPHVMIILIPYMNLLNLSWIQKCIFLRNMELLRCPWKQRAQNEIRSHGHGLIEIFHITTMKVARLQFCLAL